MKDTILQVVRDYAPALLMFVMMFIDKFGFGNIFSKFRSDITNAFDVKKISKEFEDIHGDLCANASEMKEMREELHALREEISRVKGAKK